MNFKKLVAAGAIAASVVTPVVADEALMLVAAEPTKGGTELTFQFAGDGETVAFQVELQMTGAVDMAKAGLDGCKATRVEGAMVSCNVRGSKLHFAMVSSDLSALPSENLAKVFIPAAPSSFSVLPGEMILSNAEAQEKKAEVLVEMNGEILSNRALPREKPHADRELPKVER